MRSMLFGAALLLAAAAAAQPTTNDDQPVDETATNTQPTEQPAGQPPQTAQPAQPAQPAMPMAPPAGLSGGGTVAPGNTNPETDARGIPVISAPAVAPPGWNVPYGQGTPAPASGPAPSMGAATDLPPCSRTVTDRCVQTYERGVRPR